MGAPFSTSCFTLSISPLAQQCSNAIPALLNTSSSLVLIVPLTSTSINAAMEFHEQWLENLLESFSSLSTSAQTSQTQPHLPTNKTKRLVTRNSDLIYAHGSELRMMSLAELKSGSSSSSSSAGNVKTLHTPNIAFEIQALVLNHTKKLLAVVGTHQIVVVVLPRPGYARLVTPMIECRSIAVGQYYHAAKGAPAIAKVDWHPWSQSAASLLVLTTDATLREYDVASDSEDPQQALSFTQPANMPGSVNAPPTPARKGFSADDERSEECVSFDIGKSDTDWAPLTLYGLMRNGDVYAICPFIPNQAQVPIAYIQNLRGITEAKLLDPVHEDHGIVEARLNQQMRWLNAMAKQIQVAEDSATTFKCSPPRATGSILRQGPYLVQPPPSEEEYEADASDIITLRPKELPMDVFVVAFTDGRVDVCLGADKAEGRWSSKLEASASPPVMSTYESIQVLDVQDVGYPSFSTDPVYEDTVYLSHAEGVHALVLKPWLDEVAQTDSITKDSQLVQVIKTGSSSTSASNPIVALDVINDPYLGYLLFALTNSMQLLPMDLSLRVQEASELSTNAAPAQSSSPASSAPKESSDANEPTDEQKKLMGSLLDKPMSEHTDGTINLTLRLDPVNTRAEIAVTPQSLRYLGGVVENVRKHNQSFIATGNGIQDRLHLQIKETERQIDKLAHVASVATSPANGAGVGAGKGGRVEAVANEQTELLRRMDRLLQRLMDKHQPTLSTHEKKWFAELGRIRDEVGGDDGKGRALQARMSKVRACAFEYQAYQATTAHAQSRSEGSIGASQIAKVEGVLHDETSAIEDLRAKLDKVSAMLKSD
ncbi:hypothetical protein E3P99_01621 [Wallemia hederae]|uniref:Uncharacterized protein n=1 Tax=Wallemia hederae TaxID=1540922 RepID=A0A4V4LU69_9BASI|nr:hypothetical protein E3P99_01621 [Wallemia hederae]